MLWVCVKTGEEVQHKKCLWLIPPFERVIAQRTHVHVAMSASRSVLTFMLSTWPPIRCNTMKYWKPDGQSVGVSVIVTHPTVKRVSGHSGDYWARTFDFTAHSNAAHMTCSTWYGFLHNLYKKYSFLQTAYNCKASPLTPTHSHELDTW